MKKRWMQRTVLGMALAGILGVSIATTHCSEFAQNLQNFTEFCKAVGEKCSQQTAADCTSKLGADTTVLKTNPDYAGAKTCVDGLSTCDMLPDNCWKFAVEEFKTSSGQETTTTTDGGTGE
ncbi:MAG: hypothetical protein EP343_31965 [Deltaproteobacteria bacterium]|nr:MAG: hypothetical protein EP343_31965 [Deltaproteobacteria bacterium]